MNRRRFLCQGLALPAAAGGALKATRNATVDAALPGLQDKFFGCIAAVNLGRDTDCLAAIAGGISGALMGAGAVPEEWIRQVDAATAQMPVTNSRRKLREHADGLYTAYRARLHKMRSFVDVMEQA